MQNQHAPDTNTRLERNEVAAPFAI